MISAMVFDLDGTLVQTERLKAISYARAAAALRPELDPDEVFRAFGDVVGRSRREVAVHLVDRFGLSESANEIRGRYGVETDWQAYVQLRLGLYEEMLADPETIRQARWPHNLALLERARAACGHVALATMSHCAQVRRVLSILDLSDAFDLVATRDDVERGKPDPEIYLMVAEQLAVPPSQWLCIEDSPAGVTAALAAGMRCIAVATPFTRERLHSEGVIDARWIVDDPSRLLHVVDAILEEEGTTR